MDTVRWGILGCGNVCEKKAGPALAGVRGSELVAVMRRDGAKARDFAERHRVPRWYDTVEDLLADEDLDAIYVATPDALHEEGTVAAAAAGKHVLVEKAMATSTAACDRMIAACRGAGVILAVAYYRRGYPSILRVRDMIAQGAIGALQAIWLNDEFPLSHRLDLVHFYTGDQEAVWTRIEDLPPGSHAARGEVLYCRSASGIVSLTNQGWEEKLAPERLRFQGSEGLIEINDLKEGHLTLTHRGEDIWEDLGALPATHWGLVRNFVQHVNGEADLCCDGVEGRKSTVILDIVETLQAGAPEQTVDYGQPGAGTPGG